MAFAQLQKHDGSLAEAISPVSLSGCGTDVRCASHSIHCLCLDTAYSSVLPKRRRQVWLHQQMPQLLSSSDLVAGDVVAIRVGVTELDGMHQAWSYCTEQQLWLCESQTLATTVVSQDHRHYLTWTMLLLSTGHALV